MDDILGTWLVQLTTMPTDHTYFFVWCWGYLSLWLMLFCLLDWDESLTFFLLHRCRKWEKSCLSLSQSLISYWVEYAVWDYGVGISTCSWKIDWLFWQHIFPFCFLSEILQGTICCVGVVIGIINIPSLLNDLLPSASNTSWEDLLGSYFTGTRAPHLVGICVGRRTVWREAYICCMNYLEGITFSILISLYLLSVWFHNGTRHLDMFSASCMSQRLFSVIFYIFVLKKHVTSVWPEIRKPKVLRGSLKTGCGEGASSSGLLSALFPAPRSKVPGYHLTSFVISPRHGLFQHWCTNHRGKDNNTVISKQVEREDGSEHLERGIFL